MLYEFSCLHDNEYELKVILTLCTGHRKCWLFDQIESKAFSRGWNRPVLGTSICWGWYHTHCSGTVSTLTYTHLCFTHQLTIYCDNRCMNWVSIWIKHNTNEPEKQVNRLKITKWRSFVSVQCGIRWNWLSNLSIVTYLYRHHLLITSAQTDLTTFFSHLTECYAFYISCVSFCCFFAWMMLCSLMLKYSAVPPLQLQLFASY